MKVLQEYLSAAIGLFISPGEEKLHPWGTIVLVITVIAFAVAMLGTIT